MPRGRAWLWVVLFAGLVVAAKLILAMPIKIPGHVGLITVAILVLARATVPATATATLVSALAGLLGLAAGTGDKGTLDTLTNFLSSGIAIDAVAYFLPSGALGYALQGLAGNVAKMLGKVLLLAFADIHTGFAAMPQLYPLFLHAAFGLAGGYLAFWILRARGGAPLASG